MYPGGSKTIPTINIPPPVPGGLGPAGNVVRGSVQAAKNLGQKIFGGARKAEATQKKLQDLKRLEREIAAARGPVKSTKIAIDEKKIFRPKSLAELRASRKTVPGEKTWSKIEGKIDDLTSDMGFGTGPVARAKAAATVAGSQEIGRRGTEAAMNYFGGGGGYSRGGLVKKKKARKKNG